MKRQIEYAIYLVGAGMVLVVYAHANFSTKATVKRIEKYQLEKDHRIIRAIDKLDGKIDKIIHKL